MQLGRVSQRNAGQIGRVDSNDCKVGQLVASNDFRRKNATVSHGDANVGCAIHDMVVGDDVSVRRNNHTRAQAMFDLRPLRLHLEETFSKRESRAKELFRTVLVVVLPVVLLGSIASIS